MVMSDAEVHSSDAVLSEDTVFSQDTVRYSYDVVIVGAGGSGLRAAIEARLKGKKVAIISKSLFGKAHTVMAEGGCAAAMGNVNPNDNWQVHFRDTMRGGKFLNNWRMAELHAKEAPDRVWELEAWGAMFDRTKDGKISQRNFGGHEYPRLAHVGDRTGLEMIRTLQQKVVALQQEDAIEFGDPEAMIKVFAETTITELINDGEADRRGVRLLQGHRPVRAVRGAGGGARHRRHRQDLQGHLELVGVHRRWARAGAAGRGHAAEHGVRPVAPDRDGVAAVGARPAGHRVGARRRRRAAQLRGQAVHVQLRARRVPGHVRGDRGGGRPLVRRPGQQPAPAGTAPPRRGGPRRSTPRSRRGAASPHGGVFLDIASRLPAEDILRKLPSMHHQFKELADVDITKEPMEIGPTCHYVMGGVEVDPDTGAASVPGLFAVGEVSGGMHGSNRLGGNSLSDLLVFGRRSGLGAAEYVSALPAAAAASETPTWPRRRPRRSRRWSGPRARAPTPSTPSCRRS